MTLDPKELGELGDDLRLIVPVRAEIEADTAEEPLVPNIDTRPREFYEREVVYNSGRGPNDVILSGPVIGGWGPGRYFQSRFLARRFYSIKFGQDRILPVEGYTRGRWSVLVKNLKGKHD